MAAKGKKKNSKTILARKARVKKLPPKNPSKRVKKLMKKFHPKGRTKV